MIIPKIICGFRYAFEGVWHNIKRERNFRIHLCAVLVVSLVAWYYQFTRAEAVLLALVTSAVLIAELFNTAMEEMVDLVSTEMHPRAKAAKDSAAAAVLIAAGCAVVCGGILFLRFDVLLRLWNDIVRSPLALTGVLLLCLLCYLFIRGKGEQKNV